MAVALADLDDLAAIHHGDAVGDAGDHAEIVRDQDQPDAGVALDLGEEVEDLRLDRHVERGGRLVGDDQLRLAQERHGDHHALAKPARELVRKLRQALLGRGDADARREARARAARAASRRHGPMLAQHLGHLVADAIARVERRHRILEDHGDALAAQLAPAALRTAREGLAFERDRLRASVARLAAGAP